MRRHISWGPIPGDVNHKSLNYNPRPELALDYFQEHTSGEDDGYYNAANQSLDVYVDNWISEWFGARFRNQLSVGSIAKPDTPSPILFAVPYLRHLSGIVTVAGGAERGC